MAIFMDAGARGELRGFVGNRGCGPGTAGSRHFAIDGAAFRSLDSAGLTRDTPDVSLTLRVPITF